MKNKIIDFVNICLNKHSGGESYFTELDRLIKNDSELLIDFIETTIKESGIKKRSYFWRNRENILSVKAKWKIKTRYYALYSSRRFTI